MKAQDAFYLVQTTLDERRFQPGVEDALAVLSTCIGALEEIAWTCFREFIISRAQKTAHDALEGELYHQYKSTQITTYTAEPVDMTTSPSG